MVNAAATPQEVVEDHAIWTETGFTSVHQERRGAKVYVVFRMKDDEKLSILGRDLFSWVKTAPIIMENTGYALERMEPERWRTLAQAIFSYAGEAIIISRETEEMNDLMLEWLAFGGTKKRSMTDLESKGKTMTELAETMYAGQLDAIHDDSILLFKAASLITHIKRASQGLTRDDIFGTLFQLGYERKRMNGRRFWMGRMPQ